MSDAAITSLVAGIVTVVTMLVGFGTMWLKLKYGAEKAEEAVKKAKVVEGKLDANTATTDEVNNKAALIVKQTNGSLDQVRGLVSRINERVEKLEAYNHESNHRMLDVVHTLSLKVERLLAVHEVKVQEPPSKSSE